MPKSPETIMTLTKVATNLHTYKNTIYIQIDKSTEQYTRHAQKEINLMQIVKLISTDFWKCFVLLQCFKVLSKEFQKAGSQFLIEQSANIFCVLLML